MDNDADDKMERFEDLGRKLFQTKKEELTEDDLNEQELDDE